MVEPVAAEAAPPAPAEQAPAPTPPTPPPRPAPAVDTTPDEAPPEEAWEAVYDGRNTYYYDKVSRAVSWTLPEPAVSKKLLHASSALSRSFSGRDVHPVEAEPQLDEQKAVDEPEEQWVVRVHPDSGQVYYENPTETLMSWTSAFDAEIEQSMVMFTEDSEFDAGAELQELVGVQLSPDQGVFHSAEAIYTRDRLNEWISRRNLRITDDESIHIRWAEYTDICAQPPEHTVHLVIRLPRDIAQRSSADTVEFDLKLTDPVSTLLTTTFEKYFEDNMALLDQSRDRFAFKLQGYAEYVLHAEFMLGHHESIMSAALRGNPVMLCLIRLSDADMMDLGSILGTSLEDAMAQERRKIAPDGDDWDHPELPGPYIQLDDIKWPFRVLVHGVQGCPQEMPGSALYVEINLYNNGQRLTSQPQTTVSVPFSSNPRWPCQWLNFRLEVVELPLSSRITFELKRRRSDGEHAKKETIAGAALSIVDFRGCLVSGKLHVNLWPHEDLQLARDPKLGKGEDLPRKLNLTTTSTAEDPTGTSGVLTIEFDSYSMPVFASQTTLNQVVNRMETAPPPSHRAPNQPTATDRARLERLASADPLTLLKPDDKIFLWRLRNHCAKDPRLLPKVLQSVDWKMKDQVNAITELLTRWATKPGHEVDSIQLLLGDYGNSIVREYAVRQIDRMNDSTMKEYLLQLVQAVKYEPFHDSPLVRMLLRRALRSPNKIGHTLFWLLRSEMHNADICERFGVVLEIYLRHSGIHRVYLNREVTVNNMLEQVAEATKLQPKDKRKAFAQAELAKLNPRLPPRFSICLDPRVECTSIVPEKCKVMNSKKLPLWICFSNADPTGERILVLFKAGDDLRQDLMTLQMLRIMDSIWRSNGLDLRILPYGCCATGQDLGMIEVVKNSNTTANIQVEYGGGALGAFAKTPIDRFIRQYNDTPEKYSQARETFIHTCAGYCVATYVLGIGDRHSDNIMVTESGHLFHIDFGHFLGNFKSKFGVKRERAPFVFTPEMAYVLGTEGYERFETLCSRAYNCLRAQNSLLISLFMLMVPAGMPELLEVDDIEYLQTQLANELTEKDAEIRFRREIKTSLYTVSRQVDNFIHNVKAR